MTNDQTVAELQWYHRDASADAEIPFLLGSLDHVDDAIPSHAFAVTPITRMRVVRMALLSLPGDLADVIHWAFEVRDHHPRLRSLFPYPGVAVRTDAAARALAEDETEIVMQTADAPECRWPLSEGNEAAAYSDAMRTFEYAPTEIVTGNHDSRGGMIGYLLGLKVASPKVKAIRDEAQRRVRDALEAYQAVRRGFGRSAGADASAGLRRAA